MMLLLQKTYFGLSIPDLASLLGLLVTLIGFSLTIYNVIKSKSASEAAQSAAENATKQLNLLEAVQDFSTLLSILEAIKLDARKNDFESMLEKLSQTRKSLILARGKHNNFSEDDLSTIQSAITQLRNMEKKIETDIQLNREIDIAQINHLFSEHIDELYYLLSNIRNGEAA